MKSSRIIQHTLVYAVGTVLLQALSFLLLPIYTRCLSPGEFGKLELLGRIGECVMICFLMNGLRQAVILHYSRQADVAHRSGVAGAALVLVLGFTALGALGALSFLTLGADLVVLDSESLVLLAVLAAFFESASWVLLSLSQARFESLVYVLVTAALLALRIGLTCVLVVGLDLGVWGVLLASAASTLVVIGVLLHREWHIHGLTFESGPLWSMVKTAACFVPAGLGAFALNYGDRLVLMHWADERDIGLYALGYKIALCVMLMCRTPIGMVWGPLMHHFGRQRDSQRVLAAVLTRTLGLYVCLALPLAMFSRDLIPLVAGEKYAEAHIYVLPILIAYFCLTAAETLESVFYVHGQTRWKAVTSTVSTLGVMILYAILIPRYGAHGAAAATMIGFMGHLLITWAVVRGVSPVPIEWQRLTVIASSAIAVWTVAQTLGSEPFALVLKLALWVLWLVSMWKLRVISPEEKGTILAVWTRLVREARAIRRRQHSWLRPRSHSVVSR
jgi:O-antigen/teichoic acid export membrane protein